MTSQAFILLMLAALNSCAGNILIKRSRLAAAPDAGVIEKFLEPNFFFGLVFYGVNLLLFAKALDQAPVSIAYPVLAGAGFAFLAVASTALLGERLGLRELAGMALILGGIAVLARAA